MKISRIAVSAALLASSTHAFMAQKGSQSIRSASTPLFLEPSALTEYMAKAHADKLSALQQMESKKNEEIKALRDQLSVAQQQQPPSSAITPAISGNIADMSKEELIQKLVAYQQFMSKYIVEAQQSKAKAVLAAENTMKQKYEDKLFLLQGAPQAATPAPVAVAPAQTSADTKLYQERSEKVSAAAKAGKSRWGDMENQRAAQAATAVVSPAAIAQEGAIEVSTDGDRSLYDKRITMIAAAGKAGKTRWGEMEVMKATTAASALPAGATAAPTKSTPQPVAAPKTVEISVPPEVAAADHGLRNDGGVGGPSLAERINLGAQLLQNGSAMAAPVAASAVAPSAPGLSLFEKRNMQVAAAAKAGKSRWGDFEVKKAQSIVATLPSAAEAAPAAVAVATPPEVAEADHGLRNDGGVGGPSLADRVNLGASLLGQ